jgi:hypothetical protein
MDDTPQPEALIDTLVERSVEVFPMGAAKALAQAKLGPPEKKF